MSVEHGILFLFNSDFHFESITIQKKKTKTNYNLKTQIANYLFHWRGRGGRGRSNRNQTSMERWGLEVGMSIVKQVIAARSASPEPKNASAWLSMSCHNPTLMTIESEKSIFIDIMDNPTSFPFQKYFPVRLKGKTCKHPTAIPASANANTTNP